MKNYKKYVSGFLIGVSVSGMAMEEEDPHTLKPGVSSALQQNSHDEGRLVSPRAPASLIQKGIGSSSESGAISRLKMAAALEEAEEQNKQYQELITKQSRMLEDRMQALKERDRRIEERDRRIEEQNETLEQHRIIKEKSGKTFKKICDLKQKELEEVIKERDHYKDIASNTTFHT